MKNFISVCNQEKVHCFFFKRENADKSQKDLSNCVCCFIDKISYECFDKKIRKCEALAMFLKQTFLFYEDELEPLFSYYLKCLHQGEEPTSDDPKKFFKFLDKRSCSDKSKSTFLKLSKLNTVFYILYKLKSDEIDANKILFQSQENKQSIRKVAELMSKLQQEDIEELIKLNNKMIGNFKFNYSPLCFIRFMKNVIQNLKYLSIIFV